MYAFGYLYLFLFKYFLGVGLVVELGLQYRVTIGEIWFFCRGGSLVGDRRGNRGLYSCDKRFGDSVLWEGYLVQDFEG